MSDESPAESTGSEIVVGTLKPQPHGGALLHGNPGNKGGGRPPDAFRKLARELLHDRSLLERLADIGEGKIGEIVETADGRIYCETPIREQRGAIKVLADIGMPTSAMIPKEEVVMRVAETVRLATLMMPPEIAEAYLEALQPVWE